MRPKELLGEKSLASYYICTMSCSTIKMTAELYGFIAPAKAALDSTLYFVAKSFSVDCVMSVNYFDKDIIKKAMRPE